MSTTSVARRARRAFAEEVAVVDLRRHLLAPLASVLPTDVGNRTRVHVFRAAGLSIGRGTTIAGRLTLLGAHARQHLHIGDGCFLNAGCTFDASAPITLGERVHLGHEVLLLTNSHRLDGRHQRAGELVAAAIEIGPGAWLGSRCTVLPGVTIGAGAVAAAGSVITTDVAPDTLVAGVPATVKRTLAGPDDRAP